jgi:YidC/Oxa1 family membrane protein insertase
VPSLGGPATIEQQLNNQGMQWLMPFVDGAPPLGWETTIKYLVLPVMLIISQYASLAISQPTQSDDPAMKQTQTILKFLPIMIGALPDSQSASVSPCSPGWSPAWAIAINLAFLHAGWFSLNVPSGLCIYWLTNNVLTTAQQAYLKKTTKVDAPPASGTFVNASSDVIDVTPGAVSGEGVDTRRSQRGEKFRARQSQLDEENATVVRNARGKKKGDKFAARKAKKASQLSEGPALEPVPVQGSKVETFSDSAADGAVAVADKKENGNGAASSGSI